MMSFVKKTFKESHAKLVDRLVEKAHIIESQQANERLKQLKNVEPGERMGHGSIFIAPPPGYQEQLHQHPGHQSVYSNGSNQSPMHSPGLSQASTLTSQSGYLGSPPQQYRSLHQHQHSQDCDHRGSFQFGMDQNTPAEQHRLSYLPATTYNPNQQRQSYNAYKPPPMELPAEEPPPPPPKDKQPGFAAELPA